MGGVGVYVAEHVGVAENQFRVEGVGHVGDVKLAVLLADFGIEKHVQQHVAEFLADFGGFAVEQGLREFVHFLNRVGAQTFVGLLGVPGAFHTQDVERVHNATHSREFFVAAMGCMILFHH